MLVSIQKNIEFFEEDNSNYLILHMRLTWLCSKDVGLRKDPEKQGLVKTKPQSPEDCNTKAFSCLSIISASSHARPHLITRHRDLAGRTAFTLMCKKLWLAVLAVLCLPSTLQAADPGSVTLFLKAGALFDATEEYVFAQDIISLDAVRAGPEDLGPQGEFGFRYQHDAETDYGIFVHSSYLKGNANLTNVTGGLGFMPFQTVPGTTVPLAVTGIKAKADRVDVRVDFERGQTHEMGGAEFRWFGGIRAEFLRNDVDIQSVLASTAVRLDRESRFLGADPRLGGEFRTRISET